VLIADDDVPFASMLETILVEDDRIEIVGRARTGEEAVELTASLKPDVVLMDITMPRMDGLEATRLIRDRGLGARVLMLTESGMPADAVRAERAGAAGYVSKRRIVSDLRDAVLSAA
jgi:DNA-binding NarL/FixJ family response regulator